MPNATATKTKAQAKSIKPASSKSRVKALDRCISYNEKLRLMVIEVLREESGRELQSEARFNEGEFDWNEHNAQFRADYAETPLKELMRAARNLYGLSDMDAIRERRKAHRNIRNSRIAHNEGGLPSGSFNDEFDEIENDDYEIDELDND